MANKSKAAKAAKAANGKKVPHPTDKHVGSRVRMRRMQLGISQEKLGDAIGLTFQQVQKYEKGTNRISASRMQQISVILNVPITYFYEGAPGSGMSIVPNQKGDTPDYVTEFLALPDGLKMTKAFMQLKNSELRRGVLDLVEKMAGAV